jgi:DNA-binding HxlR family transcriptional regulator/putative sterol carrier protein
VAAKRRYDDGCGIAHALNLIGERWALLIVRDLMLGPKRFTDLQAGLPNAGPNMLIQRLRDLESTGIVRRRTLPPPAGSQVYELTEWGAKLDPILAMLGSWGAESPVMPMDGEVGADSIMLAVRNYFVPDPSRSWSATYEISLGRDRFTAEVVDGKLGDVSRGQPAGADVTIDTDPGTLEELLTGRRSVGEATRQGRLTITGDARAAERLLTSVRM